MKTEKLQTVSTVPRELSWFGWSQLDAFLILPVRIGFILKIEGRMKPVGQCHVVFSGNFKSNFERFLPKHIHFSYKMHWNNSNHKLRKQATAVALFPPDIKWWSNGNFLYSWSAFRSSERFFFSIMIITNAYMLWQTPLKCAVHNTLVLFFWLFVG